MKALLVGVDGSDGSRRAAEFAGKLSHSFGAHLTVLHVAELLPVDVVTGLGLAADEVRERLFHHGQEVLTEMCDDLGLSEADKVIEAGVAPEVICAEAAHRDVDMIVVGARGHGPYRMMVGSVGSRLLGMTNRTVTIVR